MGLHFGTPLRDFADAAAAQEAAIAKHSRFYTDLPGWLIRVEACRYAYVVNAEYDEWGTTDPRLELFAFPVKRFTEHGATLKNIWAGAKERWVDLRPGAKQWASRTAADAIEQFADRRRRQLWILGKQIERARNELLLAGRCGDGRFCRACSLPAHELTQQPGCGGPLA